MMQFVRGYWIQRGVLIHGLTTDNKIRNNTHAGLSIRGKWPRKLIDAVPNQDTSVPVASSVRSGAHVDLI